MNVYVSKKVKRDGLKSEDDNDNALIWFYTLYDLGVPGVIGERIMKKNYCLDCRQCLTSSCPAEHQIPCQN